MATETSNIWRLGLISLAISVIINLMLIGFQTNAQTDFSTWDTAYPSENSAFQILTQHTPTPIACERGTDCTISNIAEAPAQSTNIFDIIQSLLNLGPLIVGLIELILMSLLLPVYMSYVLGAYITNTWLITVVTLFTTVWTMLNIWIVVKLIFRK